MSKLEKIINDILVVIFIILIIVITIWRSTR
jgi:cell division protein FtsL